MEIMICFQELLEMIEESNLKEEIENSLTKIKEDKILIEKIRQYHQIPQEILRKEIYQNENYKTYKKLENRLNKLILQSNQILGELKNESNQWKI